MKMKLFSAVCCVLMAASSAYAQLPEWPVPNIEARPGTRWWWMGSAVDSANLTRNLEAYDLAGIGTVEITPIYGVQGNEKNDISFLSPRWMRMLGFTESEADRLDMNVNMNTGTGWPFGGPEVTIEEAATCAIFKQWHKGEAQPQLTEKEKDASPELKQIFAYPQEGGDTLFIAYYLAKTKQAVKRAAPGGEGYVMDHLNPKAVKHYLERFDKAFAESGVPFPKTFFNDSYEVYGANWTPALFDEFRARRGYALEDKLPALINEKDPEHGQVVSDYRETVSDLLLEVFTSTWRDWAHSHGAKVRNQAHGSPANLLDVYAAVDIPEIEGFGLSDFGIKGLRTDSLTKHNDSDLSMLKYPASVAHFYGKPFVSAETFTWLTEHFRTSLSQCKPDFDLMMVAGVNHCFFHGTTYSPAEAQWPGHLFYASMEMSPINSIWRDAPEFFRYITRVQSWMQYGQPDNEVLVYLPVYDIWRSYPGMLLQFDIHSMAKKAPRFIAAVNSICNAGYDVDYCSDRMIQEITEVTPKGYMIAPSGVTYKVMILPEVDYLPEKTREKIEELKSNGANILNVTDPESYEHDLRTSELVAPEEMVSRHGLKCIRRSNSNGYHYFISALNGKGVHGWVRLSKQGKEAWAFNPLTDSVKSIPVRQQLGCTEVYLNLESGESCVLQLLNKRGDSEMTALMPLQPKDTIDLTNLTWQVTPVDLQSFGTPKVQKINGIKPWTDFDDSWKYSKGTASYTTTIKLDAKVLSSATPWIIDLGDVRESARVYINGQNAGTVFCLPYRLDVGRLLKPGKNTITIEVTGLVANYVAEMDRRGIKWRIFKNANIANLKGGSVSYYGNWDVMPCGLNGSVKLIKLQ